MNREPKVLAVYGSAYGQTERIVCRIAETLSTRGLDVTMSRGDALPEDVDLDQYGAFLVAASVVAGRHQRYVEEFVRLTAPLLNRRPSAFVSVSGSAASPTSAKQQQAKQYVREFLRSTGWSPRVTATFGGAIAYTKYWFFLRWMMKSIAKRNGNPTDTSRDHELTDWNAVDRFAADWAQTLSEAAVAAGAAI